MTSNLPDNLFDTVARIYFDQGNSIDRARDIVILRCLEAGDSSAFSYFVLAGHQPGLEVMRVLAFMTSTTDVPRLIADRLPFKLIPKSRKKGKVGKRVDPLIAMRDEVLALNVHTAMTGPGMYEAAISTVHDRVGQSISKKTIRNAYDRYASSLGNK